MSLQTHIDRIHEIAKDSTIQVILSIDPEIISWKHYYMVVHKRTEIDALWLARQRAMVASMAEDRNDIRTSHIIDAFYYRVGVSIKTPKPKIVII